MAADSDSDVTTWNPFALDAGEHVLYCRISTDTATDESTGYDGFIFTTDLDFIPDEIATSAPCTDDDAIFNAGTCTTNWGPNTTPTVGSCTTVDAPQLDPCTGAGLEDTCCSGVCIEGPSGPGTCN
jgi:hypothetical protein